MCSHLLFQSPCPVSNSLATTFTSSISTKPQSHNVRVKRASVRMIQRPDADGPPDLEAFFDQKRRTGGTLGAPITLATGRGLTTNHSGDAAAATIQALNIAKENLSADPQLVHCTYSVDIDPKIINETIIQQLGSIAVLGRSVNKKDASGTIEILLMRSEAPQGIPFASATVPVEGGNANAIAPAVTKAANQASEQAIQNLSSKNECTFMIFCTSPGGGEQAAREGLDKTCPGVVAYGGPAVGDNAGEGWSVLSGVNDNRVQTGDVLSSQTVHVAVVPGSLSFLFSAVIKNWAQPKYTESLSYMSPNYIDDPQIDLLTAIRYNDWDKFKWCIEEKGIGVNTKWENKQNQSPLLAACARARTEMIQYLLNRGADVSHRNDGGFTAAMYTRMLTEYDRPLIQAQLKMLEDAGSSTKLTEDEIAKLKRATSGRIVE